jgi:ABC-type enterobactin transport system permease subunit
MRKLLIFAISAAMLVGGLYLLAAELLTADIIYFRFVIAGAMLASLGAYLLWTDIVAPKLGIKTAED